MNLIPALVKAPAYIQQIVITLILQTMHQAHRAGHTLKDVVQMAVLYHIGDSRSTCKAFRTYCNQAMNAQQHASLQPVVLPKQQTLPMEA